MKQWMWMNHHQAMLKNHRTHRRMGSAIVFACLNTNKRLINFLLILKPVNVHYSGYQFIAGHMLVSTESHDFRDGSWSVQHFVFRQPLDGLHWVTFMAPRRWIQAYFSYLWFFPWKHHEVDICYFQCNVSTIGWVTMKFGSNIHVPLRMSWDSID